jgi:predicted ATPase
MLRDDGIVKVLDFGLAKLTQEKTEEIESQAKTQAQVKTQAGTILGTIFYMSPEQAEARSIDGQTDVWSLGVILYEMLTGKMPFAGATITEVLVNILTKDPKPISEFSLGIPVSIEHIVDKLLRKKKEERYQTARDLLIDLKSLQKRLEFEAELERSSPPNKQTDEIRPIFATDNTEKISIVQPNNLSTEFIPIIGREKEIAEIRSLLMRDNVRLVTLTGVGGTGKTSLSKAVARKMLADFADGVFFVELAAITNTELVASTIAQSIDVKEAGGKPILEVLKDYLRDKQMLLVIDNFEQIVDAAPQIAQLIAATNKLKILVTSRVILRLTAEREFVVPPLSMPDEIKQISLDKLLKYEAIKLFIERAQNIKPSFTLLEENAQTIAEICTRLEGLPLAIELAAARVKFLSPQAILAKLENRLKLLTGGARDLPARQQTMRGAVEWSYDLLPNDEKILFRRLAIFAGGFTLEAAEAIVNCQLPVVCQGEISEQETIEIKQLTIDILDGITSLVDKSLLIAKEKEDGDVRFRMLEVVHEYAIELSISCGDAEAMRCNHGEYFLRLGEAAEPHLRGEQAVKWLNCLEEEHDNLRDALHWSLKNDAAMAAQLAASLRYFWAFHGHVTEGRKWFKAILESGSLAIPAVVRTKLLSGLGMAARHQGDYEAARKAYEEALTESRAANDLRQIVISSNGLGIVEKQQGDFTAARECIEEALAISRQLDDKPGIAQALSSLGDLARTVGDNIAARPLIEESLTIARQLGNKQLVSNNLVNLGAVAYHEADFRAARLHYAEALEKAQELGHKVLNSYSLDGFAALAAECGETELGAQLAGAAEQLREQIGYEIEPSDRNFRDAYISELKTKMDGEDFKNAYEQGRKMKPEEAIKLALG